MQPTTAAAPHERDRGTDVPAAHLRSVPEAHVISDIPKRTIYYWVSTGKVWSITIGGRIMVHANDVEMWRRLGEREAS